MIDFRLSLIYVVALAAVGAMTFLYRLIVQRRRFNDLPCPPHSFIWGHIKLWEETVAAAPPGISPQALYTIISQKYNMPGLWYLDLWPVNGMQIVADDPESMDFVQVLEGYDHHHNIDRLARVAIGPQLVATVNGPIWHALHNRIAPAFMQSHIRTQYSVIAEEVSVFRDQFVKLSKTGEPFSMMEKTQHLVFDIVGRLIFNFSTNAQTHGSPYLEDLCESISLFIKWSGQSYWKNPLAKRELGRQRIATQDRLSALITSKIHERLAVLRDTSAELDPKTPLSVVDLLLRQQLMDDKSTKKGQLTGIAPDEMERLVTNVKGLLLGGQGTTADSLTYIFMLLSNHPEVISRMREEHYSVFGKTVSETEQNLATSPNKVNDLVYTNAVVKEALRLFPIGYSTKQSPPGATIKYQGRDYPSEGFAIVPNHQTLHFNPRYFPKPSEFKPERFLNDAVPRSYFRAFGRGQRSCVGQPLAIDILIVILLLTTREFDFTSYKLKPNAKPKTIYTDMDTVYGDIIFQTNDPLGAKPNGPMMMTVKKVASVYA